MKGRKLIDNAAARLAEAGVDNARREATFLLEAVTSSIPGLCYTQDNIDSDSVRKFRGLVERRAQGEPLQILMGEWEFFGRPIIIRKSVFIPRPETEGLVELALKRIPEERDFLGLEIGVGTGAISVNLLAERPHLRMTATDISEKALDLAMLNARKLGVDERLTLKLTDIAGESALPTNIEGKFDFVISNPPYVLTEEMAALSPEVRADPKVALDGGSDGLDITRKIIQQSRGLLKEGGFVALEIHEKLGAEVLELFRAGFSQARILKDLAGKDRYCVAIIN